MLEQCHGLYIYHLLSFLLTTYVHLYIMHAHHLLAESSVCQTPDGVLKRNRQRDYSMF